MAWHRELLIGFDLETTGTDSRQARIVTGAVIEVRAGQLPGHHEWPADPGAETPADAVALHGIAYNTAFCPFTSTASQVSHRQARPRPASHAGTRAA